MKRLYFTSAMTFTLASLVMIFMPLTAAAQSFQAGRIIDNNPFYIPSNLDTGTIQAFLNSKVPVCDTNHPPSNGNNPPFTCLKDYTVSVPAVAGDQYCPGNLTAGTKSAAQLINDVSRACNINPRAMLVLLEKEQSLITDTWPVDYQYKFATGFCVYDTVAPPACADTDGFFKQIYYAARQFQKYAKNPESYGYRAGRLNSIQYNPNAGCGASNVFIQNAATAGLYNYTPYQPNAATLAARPGTTVPCGAYGNINFWRMYNSWFGPSTSQSDAHTLNFIRLNHYSGKVELIGYPSIGDYSYINKNVLTPYPASSPDGSVIPVFRPNGDLSMFKLNHSSGKVEVTTYNSESNFQQLSSVIQTAYPAVSPDGNVIPMFRPNGDLSFIRLNHYSGKVEVVTYSFNSYFQHVSSIILTGYPKVPADGAVIPAFRPNGDLSFIRLNHYSGKVEVVTYSFNSYFQHVSSILFAAYPAVNPDGNVIPMFQPNGDLSFIRLNHYSGKVESVSYSFGSYFQLIQNQLLTGYPNVSNDKAVVPLYSR